MCFNVSGGIYLSLSLFLSFLGAAGDSRRLHVFWNFVLFGTARELAACLSFPLSLSFFLSYSDFSTAIQSAPRIVPRCTFSRRSCTNGTRWIVIASPAKNSRIGHLEIFVEAADSISWWSGCGRHRRVRARRKGEIAENCSIQKTNGENVANDTQFRLARKINRKQLKARKSSRHISFVARS